MRRRVLGKTGFEVSEISLGAEQIASAGHGRISEENAFLYFGPLLSKGGTSSIRLAGTGTASDTSGSIFGRTGTRPT